jgi:hypothetical protein
VVASLVVSESQITTAGVVSNGTSVPVKIGLCLPSSCSDDQIETGLQIRWPGSSIHRPGKVKTDQVKLDAGDVTFM